MMEFWIAQGVISIINLFSRTIKEEKSLNKAIKMFEEHDYEVNKEFSSIILDYVTSDTQFNGKVVEQIFSIIPFSNIIFLFENVKYFCGNHIHQRYYDDLYDWNNWLTGEGLNDLLEKGVIKKKEKQDNITKTESLDEIIVDEYNNSLDLNNNYSEDYSIVKELYKIKKIISNLEKRVDKKIEQVNRIEKNKVKKIEKSSNKRVKGNY